RWACLHLVGNVGLRVGARANGEAGRGENTAGRQPIGSICGRAYLQPIIEGVAFTKPPHPAFETSTTSASATRRRVARTIKSLNRVARPESQLFLALMERGTCRAASPTATSATS